MMLVVQHYTAATTNSHSYNHTRYTFLAHILKWTFTKTKEHLNSAGNLIMAIISQHTIPSDAVRIRILINLEESADWRWHDIIHYQWTDTNVRGHDKPMSIGFLTVHPDINGQRRKVTTHRHNDICQQNWLTKVQHDKPTCACNTQPCNRSSYVIMKCTLKLPLSASNQC